MILKLASMLGLNKLLVTVAVYALTALVGFGSIYGLAAWQHHKGYSAGQLSERLVWQEQQRKLLAQMEEKRKAAQAEIDRIAQEVLDQQRLREEAEAALEEYVHEMDDADRVCLDRGVRDFIDKAGR